MAWENVMKTHARTRIAYCNNYCILSVARRQYIIICIRVFIYISPAHHAYDIIFVLLIVRTITSESYQADYTLLGRWRNRARGT